MSAGVGIPLKTIVKSFLIEEGYDSNHKYLSYLHLAMDGLRELWWDVNGIAKVAVLTPDEQGVMNIPEDFVKEVRFSVFAPDGTLVPLSRNNQIFKSKGNCGEYDGNGVNQITGFNTFGWFDNPANHISNGQFIGRFYGMGGGSTAGSFKVSLGTGEIWVGKDAGATQYVLEYIGDMPTRVNGQFLVHPFLKEPLMNWIHYASKRRKATPGEIDYLFKRYVASKNWARQRFWNMDYTEVLDSVRKNITLSPRM